MKRKIKYIIKVSKIVLFLMLLLASFEKVHAYKIEYKIVAKEYAENDLGLKNIKSDYLYRKQTAAYMPTREPSYKANKSSDGWVYTNNKVPSSSVSQNNNVHSDYRNFVSIYEYVHPSKNSAYSVNESSNIKRYYASASLSVSSNRYIKAPTSDKYVTTVSVETSDYVGFYDRAVNSANPKRSSIRAFDSIVKSPNIVVFNTTQYRWALGKKQGSSNSYENINISDVYMNSKKIDEIWRKFGKNAKGKELEVYTSAVTRTMVTNDKGYENGWKDDSSSIYNTDGTYYKNMDTAYKFFEVTVKGRAGSDWAASQTITASNSAWESIINYYDNTLKLPVGNSKKIYVRHIDATNMQTINAGSVSNDMIIQGIENGQALEVEASQKAVGSGYKFVLNSTIKPTGKYKYAGSKLYSEMYEMLPTDKNWIITNMKYKHTTGYINKHSVSVAVSYFSKEYGSLRSAEQNVLDNYQCLGRIIGVGNSLESAETRRNKNYLESSSTEWTTYTVNGDAENEYIVVDFYYKKKPVDVYVRHIDVSSIAETGSIADNLLNVGIQTGVGKAFKVNKSNWNKGAGTLSVESRNTIPAESMYQYQEVYKKAPGELLRVANIKYNNSEAGSYWDLLSSDQKKIYSEYTCIGAVVGKGRKIDLAEVARNNIKELNSINTLSSFLSKSDYDIVLPKDNSAHISKGGEWTNILVNDEYSKVVIDFYYIKEKKSKPRVYVRHVDVTNVSDITNDSKLNEKTLNTKSGKAIKVDPTNWENKLGYVERVNGNADVTPTGSSAKYQELYEKTSNEDIFRIANIRYDHKSAGSYWDLLDESKKETYKSYNCIGAVVGKGSDITEAETNKKEAIKNADITSKEKFLSKTDFTQNNEKSIVTKSGDYTSVLSVANDAEVFVVDFYYIKMQKEPKNIYVRHIDATNMQTIKSENVTNDMIIQGIKNGQSLEVETNQKVVGGENKYVLTSTIKPTSTYQTADGKKYSEIYSMNVEDKNWIIPNMKYEHSTGYVNKSSVNVAVSYFSKGYSDLEKAEQSVLDDYNCLGRIIGVGNSLESAVSRKNQNPLESGSGNWTTYTVMGAETHNYIVIDFYYAKKEEEPPKIYVRHIDITNEVNMEEWNFDSFIQTNKGKAIKVKASDWNYSSGMLDVENRDVIPENSVFKYQEVYQKQKDDILRIANIRYDHSTAGSYWDLLNESEQKQYKNYYCLGAIVGKGDTVDEAEVNKASIRTSNNIKTKTDFVNLPYGVINSQAGTASVVKVDYDCTTVIVDNNNHKSVVIDFYYIKVNPPKQKVYVRHIDVTGLEYSEINSNKLNQLVKDGKVLDGEGKALRINEFGEEIKQTTEVNGYQEWYQYEPGIELRIKKDSDDIYNCIGSNITASETSLEEAKSYMDQKVNGSSSKYSTTKIDYVETDDINDGENYITVIDFYYKAKHAGVPIERPIKGRLSFYTLRESSGMYSGDDSTGDDINNPTTSDNATVYDVVPSGEKLKFSVDNAYTYMLGAINIQEQTKDGVYEFDYTLKQQYTVKYKDWYGVCSEHGRMDENISDSSDNYYCTKQVYSHTTSYETCTGVEENKVCNTHYVDHYKDCGNLLTNKYDIVSKNGSVSKTYTYKIPYKYTYYKVKNMRTYTISKIELGDSYENDGLPLFSSGIYTINPKKSYVDGFTTAKFEISSDGQKNNGAGGKTLNKTLVFELNNTGDITSADAENHGNDKTEELFEKNINHSKAARIDHMDESGIITEVDKKDELTATLTLKNDEVYYTDGITGKKVNIVGEDKNVIKAKETSAYEKANYKSEKRAEKEIYLSDYTNSKARKSNANKYEYDVNVEKDKVNVSTIYPKSVTTKYLPSKELTTEAYFNDDTFKIPEERLNGKRISFGKIYYNLLSENNVLNFDVPGEIINGDHNWNNDSKRKAVSGNGTNSFIDTEMYNKLGVANPEKTTLITSNSLLEEVMEYGEKNNKTSNKSDIVAVFTPIAFKTRVITGQEAGSIIVDHTTTNENNEITQIQKNSRFTIGIKPNSKNLYYDEQGELDTSAYIKQYYIKFDFDVQDIEIYDAKTKSGREYSINNIDAGEWIGPIYNIYEGNNLNGEARISAFAKADQNQATINSVVNQESNGYTVRAVAINAPKSLIYDLDRGYLKNKYICSFDEAIAYNKYVGNSDSTQSHKDYYEQTNIYGHSKYVAEANEITENIGRVYDFKVTDVKDVDWKTIFRTSTTTITNKHTSKAYYSGVKKWNVYTTNSNELITRTVSEIGSMNQQILPVGPYKNTNTTYTRAPKLGYKFSFDLKTTGKIQESGSNVNKEIVITPEFYYISKGSSNIGVGRPVIEKEIKLLYKNNNNKYVPADNYKLYFVPDDGYRLTFEGTDTEYRFESSNLSKATVSLGTASKIKLTGKMMEKADNMFVQIWYGEYKLPNSTIAVKVQDGKYNANEPLINGYIGIKFNIEVIEYTNTSKTTISRKLSYNQPNKNNYDINKPNTTQWDYEGYLGYDYNTKGGEKINTNDNIRLALGSNLSWKLNQEDYEFIRGTVMLYDIDERASSDYE